MAELITVTVSKSKRGGEAALLDGFRYIQRTINKTGSIQWRCRIVWLQGFNHNLCFICCNAR